MQEDIEDWLFSLRQNWSHLCTFVREVRGVAKDREGKRYWRYVYEYSPGHFALSLHAWPGLTYANDESAGWISVSVEQGDTIWMINDVQVGRLRNQRQGVGTALVQAAIAHARTHGGTQIQGVIMRDDAHTHPFLSRWYAHLGFTVQELTGGDALACFWMNLI